MVLKQSEIDNATDLGIVWPDNDHYKSFRERKLKLARQRNNGNVGALSASSHRTLTQNGSRTSHNEK